MSDSKVIGKHTPGPWKKDRYGDLKNPYGVRVVVWGLGIYSSLRCQEAEANARLIIAAPDLLNELERMVRHAEKLGRSGSIYNDARAAIAKAKGLAQ